ncbi:ATP-binding protein [Streptomyces sp. NBC_00223]|uniref:ATP-binding protein n=1 Tax=Streptomyces sp. NBC_00223 TaxID=2976008 RepID=UPI002E284BE3|nr:BTAD domain-containing putative transcriptional regulator [Streptomyces sp. NBC_00223]
MGEAHGTRYLVLGATEVWSGSTPLSLGGPRLRALLTALALRPGRPVPARTLIDEVWADTPPGDAAAALQALVARLRKTLGRAAVTSEPGGYRLDTPRDTVDLFAFEALLRDGESALRAGDPATAARTLTSALALWRGPALADLPDRAAAARPEALRLTALRLRIDADLALGDSAHALAALREAVADHPLDEAFRAQLIRALRAEGRTADALVAYDEARTVLADTLGTAPGPELSALHLELLRQPAPKPNAPGVPPAPPGLRRRGNLRSRLTSFVGRESDLLALRRDLTTARLVTLTGPGGSGKTRLAQEAAEAAQLGHDHPDGVWLAELAPLDDPSAVPHAALTALGLRNTLLPGSGRDPLRPEPYSEDPIARLLDHCAHRRLLLVLDNCEHLIGAAAHLAAELLSACPGVTVLATSREPLGVPGEVVRPVEPLPPPTAYRLFAERAATARPHPGGAPRTEDADAVREICRRLDGLPLAIELAAARLRVLSPRQIADRLDDRFRLLTSGSRTLLPRQQTLRAVVDWSWDLLDAQERTTLRALSVFAGGCTLAAAEAVCGPDALQTVAQLVDKSLVVADHGRPGGTRYRLLETIHEYAAERAAEHPAERAAAAARHTAYFRELAATVDAALRGADQLRRLEVMETELDNIRAALLRSIEDRAEPDALAITLSMGWFWWLRNYRDEANGWLSRVTALGGDPPEDSGDPMYWPRLDVRMLHLFVNSDSASAEQWSSEAIRATAGRLAAAYREGGPHAARFPGLLWPFTLYLLGDSSRVLGHIDEVVANCRRYGGDWELASALMFRTHATVDSPGGLERTDADWAELQSLNERLGDRWMRAQVHTARAEIESARGHYAVARAEYEAAHRLGEELGAHGEGAYRLARMAELAHRGGADAAAEGLLDQAIEEAERYAVWDALTYTRYLRALLLLEAGEVQEARALCDEALAHVGDGTPPPMFHVMLHGLAARITAAEGDPAAALDQVALAARTALDSGCTEPVVAGQLDTAARLLAVLGDARSAVRLSAAAESVRAPLPRSVPEQAGEDEVRRLAGAVLSAAERAEERAAGAALDAEAAVRLLAGLAEGGTAARSAGAAERRAAGARAPGGGAAAGRE